MRAAADLASAPRAVTIESIGAVLVPLEGEVAWLLPSGRQPYWRGRIEGLRYDFAR